jgi:hypothetical protein
LASAYPVAATSEPASDSSVRCTERSAPSDTALWSARTALSGPIDTAMTSSTGTSPPSLICMAASIACVSKGLRFFSPLRSIRPVEASIRFSTAASGTSFTRTQIFNASLL